MGLSNETKQLLQSSSLVLTKPSATYLSATGAYTIFTVSGGPIEALRLIGYITGAAVGAVTIAGTLNGVAGDAGAVACNGAVGTCVWYPLNAGGTILNAAAFPTTVATSPSAMIVGTSATGAIVMTYAVGTSLTMSWTLVYRKLSSASRVA